MFEIVGNFHLHTDHSDGAGTHQEVARAAAQAGLDVIVFTDHNRWVAGQEGWYTHPETGSQVLLLMGEEVHALGRSSMNHYLCLGVEHELREHARQPQDLINAVNQKGGVGFIAHPIERPASASLFHEPEIPWTDWGVNGFTGIELWNYMSEFKGFVTNSSAAVLAAFFPSTRISGPLSETLALWDSLLGNGQQVVAIGGADAHANVYSLGPIKRCVFPYQYLFRAVNTHLLLDTALSDDLISAKSQVLDVLRTGHAFVSYDLAGTSRGFRFTATCQEGNASMGDEIRLTSTVTLRIRSPLPAILRLLRDGELIVQVRGQELAYQADELGVYRVEAYRRYRFKRRGWVFTNPIYIRG